jgi:hypothetical protein
LFLLSFILTISYVIKKNSKSDKNNHFSCVVPNTDPSNSKEFICQNLGATSGIDPFSPEAGSHGTKYQWGAQTGEEGRYVSQIDDQSISGAITGWNSDMPKPDRSWSDTSKTGNAPFPPGYRVPTYAQWQAVIDNNTNIELVGS